ncbi:MAG: DUF2252 family protein [Gammaproteobacteria bacterium]|nr:DUF2252 family protein [Gammaproteobacteria bacterium]MBV9697855.1 DUF2252 family protein [Gammaproteobacteria bacterium]
MDLRQATAGYERWLAQQVPVRRADLDLKHRLMARDAFSFLRATFYRWAQQWPELCPECRTAPTVLAVGDLHVENFGTWRDAEGRLIWGVNDFDETTVLPYTQDLVRLATSALIAIEEARLTLARRRGCQAILEGYVEGLRRGGGAAVLAERYRWLRELAVERLKDQRPFWDAMRALRTAGSLEPALRRRLEAALPPRASAPRFVHRQAGLGSLGRLRVAALAEWQGGMVAREAKPLAPSAWLWAHGRGRGAIRAAQLLRRAVRVADPYYTQHGRWLVRRLAPDCSRIELASLPRGHDEGRLLWMMGWETANMHLGTPERRRAVLGDLVRRRPSWLGKAAERCAEAVARDWRKWSKINRDD